MDSIELEAKRAALAQAQEGVREAFGQRLNSRRPKPQAAPVAPPAVEPEMDVDALTRLLSEG